MLAPLAAGQLQDPHTIYASWLSRQYSACTAALLTNVASAPDARTQLASLSALMEFSRGKRAGIFDNELFFKIVSTVLNSENVSAEVLGALLEKYSPHADVYYYLLRSLNKLCARRAARPPPAAVVVKQNKKQASKESDYDYDDDDDNDDAARISADDFARNVFDLLSRLPSPSEMQQLQAEEGLQSWCGAAEVGAVTAAGDASGPRQRKKHRREQQIAALLSLQLDAAATAPTPQTSILITAKWASEKLRRKACGDAWLSFLCLNLPNDVYRKALSRLHDLIIPNLTVPLLLSDFLTHSLNRGGLDGMLALNGIFILVTQHGLEYAKFYDKLYGLLTQDTFLSAHRLRFFQLADIFLASPMVPAYTAAAFAKKFARLALSAPPAGALISIVFIHNLLRRHPACMQLMHRARLTTSGTAAPFEDSQEQRAEKYKGTVWGGTDVYDFHEADPSKARALESTLWELSALRCHADPSVSSYCAILDKDLSDRRRTAEIDVADVLTASYTSMFNREVERRLKHVPAAFYATAPTEVMGTHSAADFQGWTT